MKKIKDPQLFQKIRTFLTIYLPTIRAKSPNTINSYRDTLNLFISYLKEYKHLNINEITTGHFNSNNILLFLEWLEVTRKNSISTRNQRLISIRAFCRYLVGENILKPKLFIIIQ